MRMPLLEHEREIELATRWRDERDEKALDELVVAHGRLVVRIAWKFRASGLPIDDLIQEGNTGLLDAAERFEPERNVRFSTYATWWIMAAIQNYILRYSSMVRVATTPTQRRLFFNLRRARAKIRAGQDGFSGDEKQKLADALGVEVADIERMDVHLSRSDVSLNQMVGEEGGVEFQDFLASDAPSPEDLALETNEKKRRKEWVREALQSLTPRERAIIESRFLSDQRSTLAEIGDEFGVSKERIRQIESKALSKMGNVLSNMAEDFSDIASA